MRATLALLRERAPWLEADGEMHGDTALNPRYRGELMPDSPLIGEASLQDALSPAWGETADYRE